MSADRHKTGSRSPPQYHRELKEVWTLTNLLETDKESCEPISARYEQGAQELTQSWSLPPYLSSQIFWGLDSSSELHINCHWQDLFEGVRPQAWRISVILLTSLFHFPYQVLHSCVLLDTSRSFLSLHGGSLILTSSPTLSLKCCSQTAKAQLGVSILDVARWLLDRISTFNAQVGLNLDWDNYMTCNKIEVSTILLLGLCLVWLMHGA